MTEAKDRSTGQGYNFLGAKAERIKRNMRALKAERERTGTIKSIWKGRE